MSTDGYQRIGRPKRAVRECDDHVWSCGASGEVLCEHCHAPQLDKLGDDAGGCEQQQLLRDAGSHPYNRALGHSGPVKTCWMCSPDPCPPFKTKRQARKDAKAAKKDAKAAKKARELPLARLNVSLERMQAARIYHPIKTVRDYMNNSFIAKAMWDFPPGIFLMMLVNLYGFIDCFGSLWMYLFSVLFLGGGVRMHQVLTQKPIEEAPKQIESGRYTDKQLIELNGICERCDAPRMYQGAIYCGAGCSARAEAGK